MSVDYLPWNHPAERYERPCFRDDDLDLSYGQFAQRVAALSGQLAELGVTRGDVVAVMLPNRVEVVLAIFAAWRLGARPSDRQRPHGCGTRAAGVPPPRRGRAERVTFNG